MKICLISDTHDLHNHIKIPKDVDILIHCGDFTGMGREDEILKFRRWCINLLDEEICKEIVLVPGNHDWLFQNNEKHARLLMEDGQIKILIDETIEIMGLKIHGSPHTPIFYNWAFMHEENKLAEYFAKIPENCDILITHGPPYGILDEVWDIFPKKMLRRTGSKALLKEMIKKAPKIHAFGHIHEGFGEFSWLHGAHHTDLGFCACGDDSTHESGWCGKCNLSDLAHISGRTRLLNVACLDKNYSLRKNVPVVIEL